MSSDLIARDKELVLQAKRDPKAFGAIFDLYYNKILSYALRRVGDVELAEDITAETFAKALKNLWRFSWRGVPLSAWLYRIAGNEIRMYGRGSARRTLSLEILVENGFDPEDHAAMSERTELEEVLAQNELFTKVSAALRELPPRYQEAIALRYMEEKEIEEIAVIMNAREGTVRSLLSRGITKLREKLEDSVQQKGVPSITTDESRGVLSIITKRII